MALAPGITHTRFVDNLGNVDPSCVGIVDIPGLSLINLRTTYSTDAVMVVKFENVSVKFCELVNQGNKICEHVKSTKK